MPDKNPPPDPLCYPDSPQEFILLETSIHHCLRPMECFAVGIDLTVHNDGLVKPNGISSVLSHGFILSPQHRTECASVLLLRTIKWHQKLISSAALRCGLVPRSWGLQLLAADQMPVGAVRSSPNDLPELGIEHYSAATSCREREASQRCPIHMFDFRCAPGYKRVREIIRECHVTSFPCVCVASEGTS